MGAVSSGFVPFEGMQPPEKRSMKTKDLIDAADVKAIAAAAEAEALKNNWAVTIAIVDDGGHLLWLQRLDGAAAISSHIAPAKAHTAAMGRRESKVYMVGTTNTVSSVPKDIPPTMTQPI